MNEIIGEKIILRPITAHDTEMVLKWRNSEEVRRYFIYQKEITEADHRKWLSDKVEMGTVVQFIMLEKTSLHPFGSVYLRDINRHNKKAEYGIFIGDLLARGQGYGTEAARLMLDYAFKELALHKVSLRVLKDNLEAIHSYEAAGFVTEGIMRDEELIGGHYKDIIFMAVINSQEAY